MLYFNFFYICDNMSTIQDRVKRLIDYLELNQASFAKSIGTHQSVLSRALKDGQTFGDAMINKILLAYDNVSKEWLIEGKGGILKTGDITIKGDRNIANTGIIEGGISSGKSDALLDLYIPEHIGKTDLFELKGNEVTETLLNSLKVLKEKVTELEKEVIKLDGEVSKRDETIKGLKNELAIRMEMITMLQHNGKKKN